MALPSVYLDQNVLARVHEFGERDALDVMTRGELALVLSQLHLHETLDIRDATTRNQRLQLVTSLEASHAAPVRLKTAGEFLEEVRQHRPHWIAPALPLPTPFYDATQETIPDWSDARSDPDGLFKRYNELFLPGWQRAEVLSVMGQKNARHARVNAFPSANQILLGYRVVRLPRKMSRVDPVDRWRVSSLQWWWFRPVQRDIYRRFRSAHGPSAAAASHGDGVGTGPFLDRRSAPGEDEILVRS